ncbi:hypothetical protein DPMN_096580 [Dreissena polymorpha]|uniref:Uncharacterized protein n=1 Tax=Dreissena polymorpha TaxID=45954 RepID=A0A9D4R3S8_DREPO|nr:hypothetical protein DPMN_096580 [Dreissena polymorpha]
METTRDFQSLYFVGKLKEVLVHNQHSLAIVAMAILIQTSSVLVLSLDRVVPTYLKMVTLQLSRLSLWFSNYQPLSSTSS